MAEGGALLRRYTAYTRIEGSNPSLSASQEKDPYGSFFLAGGETGLRRLVVRQLNVRGTFSSTLVRDKRSGGPEPHAAKDGWIAPTRNRHTSEHRSRRTLPRSGGGPGTKSRDERIAIGRSVHSPSLGKLPLPIAL